MENEQKRYVIPLIITVIALLIIGGGVYIYINKKSANSSPVACTMEAKICPDGSSVGRTGPNCEFTPCPLYGGKIEFNKPIDISVNDEVTFPDGLSLILKEINDSRCPLDVQCIWQGELSVLLSVSIKNSLSDVRLGTVNNKEVSLKGYEFFLQSATETSATIIVSLNSIL